MNTRGGVYDKKNHYLRNKTMQETTMKMKLEAFEKKPPLAVFQWNDEKTEARGWLVINSLERERLWWGHEDAQGLYRAGSARPRQNHGDKVHRFGTAHRRGEVWNRFRPGGPEKTRGPGALV